MAGSQGMMVSSLGSLVFVRHCISQHPAQLRGSHRWEAISKQHSVDPQVKKVLLDPVSQELDTNNVFSKNIENFIGTIKIPIGVAGPIHVKGTQADRSYLIPIATTEAALVASISRGCKVLSLAGGATSHVVDQRVSRAPVFSFDSLPHASDFTRWVGKQTEAFTNLASTTSKHGKLVDIHVYQEGSRVNVKFDFNTGDASGQNMATFATKKIFDFVKQEKPVGMIGCWLEGGHSSDKKASAGVLQNTRGRKVIVEAIIPKEVLMKVFRTTPLALVTQRVNFVYGHATVGQIGTVSGNVANVLAAMYIACGQDPACVAEGHAGISRFEQTDKGDLHCSLTLPGLLVATVGGGTALPSQSACLSLLGCKSANELAEVIGAVCLAAELSIIASFCTDEFANAHFTLARSKL